MVFGKSNTFECPKQNKEIIMLIDTSQAYSIRWSKRGSQELRKQASLFLHSKREINIAEGTT